MTDALVETREAPTDAHSSARGCARCGGPVDVRTRHLFVDGSVVRAYCSTDCAQAVDVATAVAAAAPARSHWYGVVRAGLALPLLLLTSGHDSPAQVPPVPMTAVAPVVTPEPPVFGPAWPPSEQDWMAEIASDAWIHPLDGPQRKMPVRDGRVFGAERPGERPAECRSGHCGVDIGGEVWGEPIHAVHDGVVDRVQRGPNEDHGGLYVRLSHRDGTIFTQYFHLAAIPRRLEPGVKVKVGEVVGLLGDSGVKHSTQHLHFTVSVKPAAQLVEQYMDPEPLIALWPLRLSVPGSTAGAVNASAAPGVPLGSVKRPRARRVAALPIASGDDAAVSE